MMREENNPGTEDHSTVWQDQEPEAAGPLSRFRVIDLTHARAGPSAVRHLADWGARVIRVERPLHASEEDIIGRRDGSDYQNLHRNKRSLTLNLKSEDGKRIFRKLVRGADVLVENMRPNVKHKLGVDYETLHKINPRLVYGSISGFGEDGPLASRGGVDQIVQGLGGLMSVTGHPGQGPVRVGVPIADLAAGAYLAQGLLIALLEREVSGIGRWVRTSLLQAQIAMLDFQATRWLIEGKVPGQQGNDHPTAVPMGTFIAGDSVYFNVAASSQRLWPRLCKAIGHPELAQDERFATSDNRKRNKESLRSILSEIFLEKTAAEWVEVLSDHGIPAGEINTIDKVFENHQVKHLPIVKHVRNRRGGSLPLIAQPYEISGYSNEIRRPTPEIGENTEEILQGIGESDAEIIRLTKNGDV